MKKEIAVLNPLLMEGEEIYLIHRMCAMPIYVIGPQAEDFDKLDVSGMIEDTLHRLLENDIDPWDIIKAEELEMLRNRLENYDDDIYDEEEIYDVDLGYVIHDFYPTLVEKTGCLYNPTAHSYTLICGVDIVDDDVSIPDDASDEEIIMLVLAIAGNNAAYTTFENAILIDESEDKSFMKIVAIGFPFAEIELRRNDKIERNINAA